MPTNHFAFRLALIAFLAGCLLTLGGCSTSERLQQAEAIALLAAESLAEGEAAVEQARAALSQAEALADRVDSQAATEAVAAARDALGQAEAVLPDLQRAATQTAEALAAAREANANGGHWWQVLLSAGAALATGGVGGAAVMGVRSARMSHALRGTIAYVDALTPAADAHLGIETRKRLANGVIDGSARRVIDEQRTKMPPNHQPRAAA